MSEQLPNLEQHEKLQNVETKHEHAEHHAPKHEKHHETKHEATESLAEIQAKIEQHATSKNETTIVEQTPADQHTYTDRSHKNATYRRTIKQVQSRLPARKRAFSHVIHQPVVEVVSEAASGTVARPSGVLGGGICALIGSSVLLYFSQHYGFRYNFFVFIALFLGGFIVGIILELLLHQVKRRRR
jgi:cation transport ATPase